MPIQVLVLFLLIGATSCKSQTNTMKDSDNLNTYSNCPDNGDCSFKVLPNTSNIFNTDEFDIGYLEQIKTDSILLIFEYNRHKTPNNPDDYHIERVYIELPSKPQPLALNDVALQQVNLLFERLCYCKGETGVYQISNGSLTLTSLKQNKFHLNLHFSTSEVPQSISEIDELFSLK